jgi:hypothetical protein
MVFSQTPHKAVQKDHQNGIIYADSWSYTIKIDHTHK